MTEEVQEGIIMPQLADKFYVIFGKNENNSNAWAKQVTKVKVNHLTKQIKLFIEHPITNELHKNVDAIGVKQGSSIDITLLNINSLDIAKKYGSTATVFRFCECIDYDFTLDYSCDDVATHIVTYKFRTAEPHIVPKEEE